MDLKTTIAGIELEKPVFNASGCRDDNMSQLIALGESECSAILMKSCTMKKQLGNEIPRYFHNDNFSINSMGLPNPGYKEYVNYPGELKKHNKPVIASIAGNTAEDFLTITKAFQESTADLIELDLSCPNVVGEPIIGYNFELTEQIIKETTNASKIPIGLKMAPYLDLAYITKMSKIIEKYKVGYIACINTIGNTMIINPETEKPMIKPKGGFGGMGGKAIKPVAIANVHAFYKNLKGKVDICGVGGIESGTDVFEYLLAGASSVQIGTGLIKEGPLVFTRVNKELTEILKRKNYTSIKEVVGNLKEA